jgi:hypothetical protein
MRVEAMQHATIGPGERSRVFGLFALESRPSLAPWDAQLRIVGGMSSHTIGVDHDSDEVVALKQALSNKGTPCFMG